MTAEETEIRQLDPDTIAKIAAGEVVERPASVVKELVENSLDADASRIEVAVENGGIDRVRIRDDGIGMTEADVRAAVREHTTSKLDAADELQRVGTLGFRGEALHTIGAVSRLTITTRPRDAGGGDGDGGGGDDPAGDRATRLRYVGGGVEAVEPAGHPPGTTVEVEDLFHNTPARRKYLAEPATEFRHVSRVVGRYALANPDVAVSLEHDGSEVFATDGRGDRLSAIMAVYGREVAEAMIEVDVEPETPAVDRIHGSVSHPETTRASRDYLGTYVNGRYVEPDVVRSAIVDAYGGQLAADRYPFAALFVEVPPDRVDVNVHPRKLAVRFDDENAVGDAVREAVRDALLDAGLVRSSAPRGRSAPEETDVRPLTGDDGSADGDAPDDQPADDSHAGSTPAARDDSERSADANSDSTSAMGTTDSASTSGNSGPASPGTSGTAESDPATAGSGSRSGSTEGSADARSDSSNPGTDAASAGSVNDATSASTPPRESESDAPDPGAGTGTGDASGDGRKFDATEQRTLDGDAVSREREFDSLPPLRVLGQLGDTYVVAEGPDGMVVIDQHAADERVHYERLQDAIEDGGVQALVDPVTYSLTPAEAETVDDYAEALARLGFHADRIGRELEVRTVPSVLGETLDPDAVHDALAALLDGGDGAATVEATVEELLADLACAPAVTGNTSLADGSIAALLSELDACENPYECPHGRPTVVRIDADELDDRFERDYPGHGQRRE